MLSKKQLRQLQLRPMIRLSNKRTRLTMQPLKASYRVFPVDSIPCGNIAAYFGLR